jgi:excisionase family DNA binding protein
MAELATVEEVARLLKLQPYTVREWARLGKLKGRKYGRVWRFKSSDIQAFIGDNQQSSGQKD